MGDEALNVCDRVSIEYQSANISFFVLFFSYFTLSIFIFNIYNFQSENKMECVRVRLGSPSGKVKFYIVYTEKEQSYAN